MLDIFFTNEQFTTDLNLYHCGIERKPGHSYGWQCAIIISFIIFCPARFLFLITNIALQQKAGVSYPGLLLTEADQVDPWHYVELALTVLVETYLEAAGFSGKSF